MRKEIFTCDICNKEYHRGSDDRHPSSQGWIEIRDNWFCPEHEITVDTNDGGYIQFNRKSECIDTTKFQIERMYRVTPNN